jgi:hypothetical protein
MKMLSIFWKSEGLRVSVLMKIFVINNRGVMERIDRIYPWQEKECGEINLRTLTVGSQS